MTSATPNLAARYRAFHDLVRVPMGGGHEIVYAPLARTSHVLSPARLALLLSCHGVASLGDHAARAAGGSPAAARAVLEEFARGGLLVAETELLRLLAPTTDDGPARRISTLAIPTRDRIGALERALGSFVGNAKRHGRTLEYLVLDDGTTMESRSRTRVQLATFSKREAVTLLYAGPEQITRYADSLAQHSGISRDIIAFALENPELCPFGVGKSRNAILLHATGELVVQVDDDTHADFTSAPDGGNGIALTGNPEPSEFWFPDADVSLPSEDHDFCALHERLLGRRPGDCIADRDVDLEQSTGMFFRRLRESGGGRVLSTQLGSNGDSGTTSMFHLLALTGASRTRLLASEAVYRHAISSRRALRAASRHTIADAGFCMGMALGLDNRELMPPFFPVMRNSDGVFGAVLKVCAREGYSGFLPFAIAHDPVTARTSSIEEVIADVGRMASADIVCQLVLASRVEASSSREQNLRAIGAVFQRWGSLPRGDFEEIARLTILRARGRDLSLLDELLRATERSPTYWARDVERVAVAMVNAAKDAALVYPCDLIAEFGEDAGRTALQTLVRRYGELLQIWPDLVEASKELKRRGQRLAEPA